MEAVMFLLSEINLQPVEPFQNLVLVSLSFLNPAKKAMNLPFWSICFLAHTSLGFQRLRQKTKQKSKQLLSFSQFCFFVRLQNF